MKTIITTHNRNRIMQQIAEAPDGWICDLKEPTRSLSQNALMWGDLSDVSNQVEWYGRKLIPEDWKHIFSAALKKQDVVPGIDGGFVILGQSTSKMTIKEMADMIELIHAFGAEHGVRFTAREEE